MAKTIESDALVIGGGGAAARAALEAHLQGSRVVMVMKGKFGECGATAYKVAEMAGYNVADGKVDPEDNPEVHFEDICKAASGMCDQRLAKLLAYEALQTVPYLERLGVKFEKDGDRYMEVIGCFASRPRMHIIKGHSEPIIAALKKQIDQSDIHVHESTMITNLLVEKEGCLGAVGSDEKGHFVVFQAKSTVLGTGGAGQLFRFNMNPPDVTGDGYAMGYRAGAELVNMEFMQAGPAMIYPIKNIINSWLWLLLPRLYNDAGEEFLYRYLPQGMGQEECFVARSGHYPFSTYDGSQYLDIAIHKEIKAGRRVWLDFTKVNEANLPDTPRGEEVRRMWSLTRDWLRIHRNLDLKSQPVEIASFGHAINGGLRIDERAQSTIPGLYAAGETAGGPHGADRLGGNMILTCQVFGARAGRFAAQHAKGKESSAIPQSFIREEEAKIENIRQRKGRIKPEKIKEKIKEAMWEDLLIVRSETSLRNCLRNLETIEGELSSDILIEDNKDLTDALEIQNMIDTGRIMVKAALIRKESRGSHYREDYPVKDDENFSKSIITKKVEEQMIQYLEKLPMIS